MSVRKAILKSFNPLDYVATIQLIGSYKAYLEDVAVAHNIPETEMAVGRNVTVLFLDAHNVKEAVIFAVYTSVSG